MRKIGILYDNISGNTGDVAIGISIKNLLIKNGIKFDELVIGQYNPLDYDKIIIGGGHLIRPSPDVFYDKFKISGNHILNSVGIIGDPNDLNYLNNYEYISVRSSGDKEKLMNIEKDVHVVPCTTMCLEDIDNLSIEPIAPSIGIHLIPWIFKTKEEEDSFIKWANTLPFNIYFLPITHYNYDINYMRYLQNKIKNSNLLPILRPLEIFTLIGKFNYFISNSLHGSIFSYIHNVPFILYNADEKMRFFMEDRGLIDFLFSNNEMQGKFNLLVDKKPDYSNLIKQDKEKLNSHIQEMLSILKSSDISTIKRQDFHCDDDKNIKNNQIFFLQRQIEHLESESISLQKENDSLKKENDSLKKENDSLKKENDSLKKENNELIQRLSEIEKSVIWSCLMKFQKVIDSLFPQKTRRRYLYNRAFTGGRILINEGFSAFLTSISQFFFYNTTSYQYKIWIKQNEPAIKELRYLKESEQNFSFRPKISIILPVWNVEKKWLQIALKSVIKQIYTNWELCIVDGGSTKPYIKRILTEYAKKDTRIKLKFLIENKGIAENSNEALSLATGDFIGFLDHDDELPPFALYEVVKKLNQNQNYQFIYSDEDKIDEKGNRRYPFFKPDWSPDTFLSQNYLCHFSVIQRTLVDSVGGFRKGYDGSQDYDLFLRCTEKIPPDQIGHIPNILYHWRMNEGSAANNPSAKPYAFTSAKKALEDALIRRNLRGEVKEGLFPSTYRIQYAIIGNPCVSVIIPTKDNVHLLRRCIESILEKTEYDNYEIVIIDNQSSEDETFAYYHSLKSHKKIKILYYNKPFNYSAINNFAVGHIESPYILFLNNDTEVVSNEWLSAMLEHAQRDCIGAVGAKLLYPNNQIQHAGVILGITGKPGKKGVAGHSNKYLPDGDNGYFSSPHIIKNYSAVTAACLMMRREVFQEVGGFDENIGVAFNDVDLCLKIREKGYLIIYTPYAKLFHHESLTRGYEDTPEKKRRFNEEAYYVRKRWGDIIDKGDPYYNENLTKDKTDFSIG